jgi:Mrp family chromosome partitioning ATPase
MLEEPQGVQAEAFRMFRTNLDFVRLERDAKTVMITSAIEEEGKSTTIANLAIAAARSGKRVTLVDLDLRRPYLDQFFRLNGHPGVAHVALGQVELEQAIVSIPLGLEAPGSPHGGGNGVSRNNGNKGNGDVQSNGGNGKLHVADKPGLLEVLTAGAVPPDTGEFVGKNIVAEILGELARRCDLVLIDAPPILRVGDALTLSTRVDALLIVARANILRRGMLSELRRLLDNVSVSPLGFVLTGADADVGGYYSSGYYRYHAPRSERESSHATHV